MVILQTIAALEGKTIVKVREAMEGAIFITSEGVLFLKGKAGYDGDADVEAVTDLDTIMSDWSWGDLVEIGFSTKEELEAHSAARKDRYAQLRERNARLEYERLKKKFEG